MAAAPDPDEVLRSTRGKGNFQRLSRLLISGGTTLLREIFDQICPPSILPTILKNPATEKQLKVAKLTKPQWDCLYPSPGVYGESADFDVTLLFRLLRTICSLTPPATGWDLLPASTDQSLAADLARIKYYRNSVYGHVNLNMEITDDEFPSLWQNISEVLVRIAGQISSAKKHEWQKAVDAFLIDSLTAEDERNVQELLRWYDSDTEVKQSIEILKTSNKEGMGRLEKNVKSVQEELERTARVIEKQCQFLENTVQKVARELVATAKNAQSLVREEAQDIKGELKNTTQNVQCLVREEAHDIKGELKASNQNVQCLVREESQDIKDQLSGELQTVQSLVHNEAQNIKGELKTTTQNVQSVVREESQDIKNKLAKVHQSIDGLRSKPGSPQAAGHGVQIRLQMDCEAISTPDPQGGASEIAKTSRELQPSVQSATVVPVASRQQPSPIADSTVDNLASADLPSTQGVLNFIAHKYFQVVGPSKPEELNGFVQYLRDVRDVLIVSTKQGSLIITLECRSLQILEELWEDYCLGHLNKMAQKYLVTEELLEEFGLTAVKLKTAIVEEEYAACQYYFLQSAVYCPRQIERETATGFGPQMETSELFLVAAQHPHLDFRSCMQIFIKLPTGRTITLEVKPETSIKDVKLKLQESKRIPPDQQRIFFIGKRLEDYYTLKSYHITNESTLQVRFVKRKIFVTMPYGNKIALEVEPETSVRDLKATIQHKEGIPPDQHHLEFRDEALQDDRTLESYHIVDESTLVLCLAVKKIFVKMPDGTISLKVKPETSIRDVKIKIQDKEDIPPDKQHLSFWGVVLEDDRTLMEYRIANGSTLLLGLDVKQIFVKMPSEREITLQVKPETSIRDVKLKIQEKRGIPPHQQRFFFRDKELEDNYTLKGCHITNESILQLRLVKKIFVKMPSGNIVSLEVEPETSVRDVKYAIQRKAGIPPDEQHLEFKEKVLEDGRTLESYYIPNESSLVLRTDVWFRQIFVKMPDGTMSLNVKPETSIRDVKIKIQDKAGIPPVQQHLIFNGMELADDRTMWHYNIPNVATLNVRGMQIYVVLPTGNETTLDVFPSDSVKVLKKRIYEKTGVSPNQQRLIFHDTQLEDGRSLGNYNIREGSMLFVKPTDLKPRLAIFVRTPIGMGMIKLDVAPSDTVKDIKEKIMDKVGIPVDRQELIFDDNNLKDDRTIDYYNIQKESILQLNLKKRGNNMQLFVKTSTGTTKFTLNVLPEDTLQTVRRKIMDEVGIPIDKQKLTFAGRKLQDGYTLKDYSIRSGSTLRLDRRSSRSDQGCFLQ